MPEILETLRLNLAEFLVRTVASVEELNVGSSSSNDDIKFSFQEHQKLFKVIET